MAEQVVKVTWEQCIEALTNFNIGPDVNNQKETGSAVASPAPTR